MELRIGFSPCPNDTYIFDALVHRRIDTEGLSFNVVMDDVEALNKMATHQTLEVTKLSFHAFFHVLNSYQLLQSGGALGHNCGPLLIAKEPFSLDQINQKKIAIPGQMTTAHFLLQLRFGNQFKTEPMLFSAIEDRVLDGTVDAGLIIHENRFTYHERGLGKLIDLGQWWENTYQHPIPLGGIVVRRDLSASIKQKLNRVIRRSVEYANQNPSASLAYTKKYAQEMDIDVLQQHIQLYVNEYSVDLGQKGKEAIQNMHHLAVEQQVLPSLSTLPLFVQ